MADTSLIESKIGLLIWKTSNHWQSNLRKVLKFYNVSLNEYLVLQSTNYLLSKKKDIKQTEIAAIIAMDISVVSVTLKLLEKKQYISRNNEKDNRRKSIQILKNGEELYGKIHPLIEIEEKKFFDKLKNETFNFTNSLKLILGRKIRIKAEK